MRFLLTILLVTYLSICCAQPQISQVQSASTGSVYEKYEISFALNSYNNPYDSDEIDAHAVFTGPNGETIIQNAFWYEEFEKTDLGNLECTNLRGTETPECYETFSSVPQNKGWKVRFAPPSAGTWSYKIIAVDDNGSSLWPNNGKIKKFSCINSLKKGHVRVANKKYLGFPDGSQFFPVGSNLPRFNQYPWRGENEYGTNEIISELNDMTPHGANYYRIEINYHHGINIFGYDFASQTNYCHYFNQKDASQLDILMDHADLNDVYVLFACFAHSFLGNDGGISNYIGPDGIPTTYGNLDSEGNVVDGYMHGAWALFNPFNTNVSQNNRPPLPDFPLDLDNPYEWYTKESAKDLQKKILRYIQARWGYSDNLLGYELMDEADRLDTSNENDTHPFYVEPPSSLDQDIIDWHLEMYNFISSIDPYDHLITTAFADKDYPSLDPIYQVMDFTQVHYYTNYIGTGPDYHVHDRYYNIMNDFFSTYDKPVFIGEFAYIPWANITTHDPHLYNLKDIFWATAHMGYLGAPSFWTQYDINPTGATSYFSGINKYYKDQLSSAHNKFYSNKTSSSTFRAFFLNDNNNDEIFGWVQDINFSYKSLLESLTNNNSTYLIDLDYNNRPPNSSSTPISFDIPLSRKGTYNIKWFNTTTGVEYSSYDVQSQTYFGTTGISIVLPPGLRNTSHGDGAFKVTFLCEGQWNTISLDAGAPSNVRTNSPICVFSSDKVNYVGTDNRIHQLYWNDTYWQEATLNQSHPANIRFDSDMVVDDNNDLFYIGNDNRIHRVFYNNNSYHHQVLDSTGPQNVKPGSKIAIDSSSNIYFVGNDSRIHTYRKVNINNWINQDLDPTAPANVLKWTDIIVTSSGQIVYTGDDKRLHYYTKILGTQQYEVITLNPNSPANVRTQLLGSINLVCRSPLLTTSNGNIYFIANDDRIHYFNFDGSTWNESPLLSNGPQNVKLLTDLYSSPSGKFFYIGTDNRLHQYYNNQGVWHYAPNNNNDPSNVKTGLGGKNNQIFYASQNNQIWVSYWGCNDLFKSHQEGTAIDSISQKKQHSMNFEIYPNPSRGEFDIVFTNLTIDTPVITVFNLRGQQIPFYTSNSSKDKQHISLQNQASGFYFVQTISEEIIVTKKILITD